MRKDGELVPVSWGEALAAAATGITAAKESGGSGAVAVIGGARLTNEAAYAWAKLAKGVIGTDSVDAQLGDGLPAELVLGLPRATIDEACRRTAAGHAVPATCARSCRSCSCACARPSCGTAPTLIEIAPAADGAQPAGRRPSWRVRPGDAPLVARALTGDDAAVRPCGSHHEGAARRRAALDGRARRAGRAHPGGDGVVIVVGRPSYAESGEVTAEAVARAGRRAARRPRSSRRCGGATCSARSTWAWRPGVLPGRVSLDAGRAGSPRAWGSVPGQPGPRHRRDPGLDGRRAATRAAGAAPVARSSCSAPTRSSDFPDHALADQALSARPLRRGGDGPPIAVGRRVRRRRAAVRGGARAAGHDDQHRGPRQPPRPEAVRAGLRLAGLDDRRRARRRARCRPRVWPAARPHRGDRRARPRPTRADREVLHSDAAHDGVVVPLARRRGRHRRRRADRPDGAARRRVGRAPGRAARASAPAER